MQGKLLKLQRGLSLIIVVFILVALSILASSMVQVLAVNSESVAREVLSARAFMAAESGAQRLLNEISNGTEADCATTANTEEAPPVSPASFPALEGCGDVTLTCKYVENVPVGSADIYYSISSLGVCGPLGDRASRRVEVQAKNI
jgi:MSHA biogenesis protein MshP